MDQMQVGEWLYAISLSLAGIGVFIAYVRRTR